MLAWFKSRLITPTNPKSRFVNGFSLQGLSHLRVARVARLDRLRGGAGGVG
jgi:hypothetical protein